MSEPFDPAMDEESYAAALDRLLDGLDGDGPADAQVRADTEAIARGLGLIGGALAAEGADRGAAAAAPAATVVAMSSWRSKLNPRALAAAASLVVVLGVGIPLAVSSTGGGGDADESVAGGAAQSVQDTRAAAPEAAAEAFSADAGEATAGAGTSGTTAATDTAAGSAAGAPATGADAANGGAVPAPQAPASLAQREAAAKTAATQAFADDVACARAIFVGTITALQPMPDGKHFQVSFLVEDWIVPDSGAVAVTYEVLGSTVNSPGVDENTVPGQRRLFVIPGSPDERMYAYREKDWAETRRQIEAARKDRAGEGC